MTVNCYVKIVGARQGDFKGGSTAKGHEGAIAGLSADYALTRTLEASSGGSTGKFQHVPVQITLASGPATPQLLQAMVTGEDIKSVTIDFVQPVGAQSKVVESIVITNAQIAGFQHHLDPDPAMATSAGQLRDLVALKFQKLQITNAAANTTATDTWQ
jgi:type VI secretion system secreted protein Hcp